MSSSSDLARRVRVLRHSSAPRSPELVDLDSLSEAGRRAVDPAVVEEAVARGHADGVAAGRREGFEAGRAEALAEAERSETIRRERAEHAVAALARAAAELTAEREQVIAGLEEALVSAAVDLAEVIIGRELATAEAPGRDALVRALRLAEGREPATVRLHPDDLATLGDPAPLATGRELTVVADASIASGDCLVDVGDGCIDARIGPAIERVREELGR